MIEQNWIENEVQTFLGEGEFFLVGVNVSPANKIEVFIDGDAGLPLQKCIDLSRHLESQLDREQNDFELTVSSPGLGSPMTMTRQIVKHLGKQVKFVTNDGQVGQGELIHIDDHNLKIRNEKKVRIEGRKKKEIVVEETELNRSSIKELKLKLAF